MFIVREWTGELRLLPNLKVRLVKQVGKSKTKTEEDSNKELLTSESNTKDDSKRDLEMSADSVK